MADSTRPLFWADGLDIDLAKLFPDLAEILGATADQPLWTVGGEKYGRLHKPTLFSGAIFWPYKVDLPREDGYFRLGSIKTSDPEIECTWLEVLRDWWPHGYSIHFGGVAEEVQIPRARAAHFDDLLMHVRGYRRRDDIQAVRSALRNDVIEANRQFAAMLENWRHVRFAAGSIPFYNAPRIPMARCPMLEGACDA